MNKEPHNSKILQQLNECQCVFIVNTSAEIITNTATATLTPSPLG